jgi:hypothetical protein
VSPADIEAMTARGIVYWHDRAVAHYKLRAKK